MIGLLSTILTSYGLGVISGILWAHQSSSVGPRDDKGSYDDGFNAAMAVIRKRNSERGKKAAARRRSAQP